MKHGIFQIVALSSVALLMSCSHLPVDAAAQSCGKQCLTGITDRYLEAMARGNLDGLPLASNLRVTSNSQVGSAGNGDTWQPGITIVNRHTFVDPNTRTSIFFGTIAGRPDESRVWWHYVVRLGIDTSGNIFEIEEQSNRGGFQTADKVESPFKETADFRAILPEDERVSVSELIRAADDYWDGLTSGAGEGVRFGPDCQRTEFGKFTTNSTLTHDRTGNPQFVPKARIGKSCRSFFDAEKFRWPTDNRRYYVIDEARGVIVGIGQLHQYGADGIPGITLFEAFKVVNGRIEFLWAPALNWGLEESGWPDWERSTQ